ncbi:MAG TPA: hypothetical protein VF916_12965, partial [Ktedonobacterales bacterium]
TGFYIFRLLFTVFLGSYRGGEVAGQGAAHGRPRSGRSRDPLNSLHSVGWAMGIPMAILGALALVGGFDGLPGHDALGELLAPVVGAPVALSAGSSQFWLSLTLGLAAGLLGIGIAWTRYGARQPALVPSRNPLYQLVAHKYFVDDLYGALCVRPIEALGRFSTRDIEGTALDGGARGVGWVTARVSAGLRTLQTGYVRNYALAITLGAIVILLYYIVRL